MKRIMQVEIQTAEEWGNPDPDDLVGGWLPGGAIIPKPDDLLARVVNPRTGETLMFDVVDERWLAE